MDQQNICAPSYQKTMRTRIIETTLFDDQSRFWCLTEKNNSPSCQAGKTFSTDRILNTACNLPGSSPPTRICTACRLLIFVVLRLVEPDFARLRLALIRNAKSCDRRATRANKIGNVSPVPDQRWSTARCDGALLLSTAATGAQRTWLTNLYQKLFCARFRTGTPLVQPKFVANHRYSSCFKRTVLSVPVLKRIFDNPDGALRSDLALDPTSP